MRHNHSAATRFERLLFVLILIVTPAMGLGQAAPPAPPRHAALAPLSWLAGGRWVASSDDPKAPNLMRESFFEWSPNGQAMRFWSFITNKQLQRRPYVEGWYVFHPGRKELLFSYVDAGGYYAGTATAAGDTLEHEFEGVSSKGAVQKFRYTFTRRGDDEMLVRIFDRSENEWRQVVELVYRRQPF